MEKAKQYDKNKVLDMVLIAMFSVLISACSWVTIPSVVPFTLQTFGVFCTLGFLGGKKGTLSIIVYMLLGAVGLPVFSGFKGGVSALFGVTGGYIVGFLVMGLVFWLITGLFGNKNIVCIIAMAVGLILLYAFGTAWFVIVYSNTNGAVGVMQALTMCVFPYIIPDALKLALAVTIINLVPKKYLNR